MASHKKFLQDITDGNHHLATDIQLLLDNNSQTPEQTQSSIKNALLRMHDSMLRICEHRGHPRTPNKLVLDAYRSFFQPIRALSQLPTGDFVSARMLLYLMDAISSENALDRNYIKSKARVTTVPLFEFAASLDDALLERLRGIWTHSKKTETFRWAFGSYTLRIFPWDDFLDVEGEKARRRQLFQALTPEELATIGGMKNQGWLFAKQGESQDWRPLPDDLRDLGPDASNPNKLMFKQTEQDGPIRATIHFHTIDDTRNDEKAWRQIDALRRSRQFILDARHINAPILTDRSHRLARKALAAAGMPAEMVMQIFSYLDIPKAHPYLATVDIAQAYAPFPEATGLCDECKLRTMSARDRRLKFTCLDESIYLWNLALRAFHVFHRGNTTTWKLCRDGLDCDGHHEDSTWEVDSEEELAQLAEAIIQDRCGAPKTLDQVGFGQDANFRLSSVEEDEVRRDRMFPRWPQLADIRSESEMVGGIGGLIDMMLHQRLLLGAWTSGQCSTDGQWSYARNMMHKKQGEDAISSLHGRCRFC